MHCVGRSVCNRTENEKYIVCTIIEARCVAWAWQRKNKTRRKKLIGCESCEILKLSIDIREYSAVKCFENGVERVAEKTGGDQESD